MRRTVGNDSNVVAFVAEDFGLGNGIAGIFKFASQTVHVVPVVVGTLAVMAFLVVSATAGKPRPLRVIDARQGAIADAVVIHVFVARESTEAVKIFFAQNLATLDRL